jgi:hypothetical protein
VWNRVGKSTPAQSGGGPAGGKALPLQIRPPIKLRACHAGYVVRIRVVFQTMVRKIGVGSFRR